MKNLLSHWQKLSLRYTKIFLDVKSVSYTHLRAHETRHDLVCRLLLEKKILIEKAKQTEIYKNFMENFPDAELVDVKSISKEDKDND